MVNEMTTKRLDQTQVVMFFADGGALQFDLPVNGAYPKPGSRVVAKSESEPEIVVDETWVFDFDNGVIRIELDLVKVSELDNETEG